MKCIDGLKKRLSINNTIVIQNEDGYVEEVLVKFNPPISIEEIDKFEKTNNITLPDSYKEFLQITNGATLFKDMKYGQWGCNILSIDELYKKTNYLRDVGFLIKDCWLIFAEWLGDGDILLFDLDKIKKLSKDYILDGDEGYNSIKWEYIKGDFEDWIDRLIVSQGSKYWRWY